MEQDIRFCRTSDGVRIAYATSGSGPPLICNAGWVSHVELNWENPMFRSGYEQISEHFTLIRYDKRGVGLSDRDVTDVSFPTRIIDLEAVIADLDLDRFHMWGLSEGGPVSIQYAALNPDRVRRLVVWGTFARGAAMPRTRESGEALAALVRVEWGLGSTTLSNMFMPGASPEAQAVFARSQRLSATADMAADLMLSDLATDVTEYLERVRAPTLVIHSRGDRAVRFDLGREVAAGIPRARLLAIESNQHAVDPETGRHIRNEIVKFLLEDAATPATASPAPQMATSGTATILFLDIADSTSLTERLGDSAFRSRSRGLDASMRTIVRDLGGTPIEGKLLGDGVMATFASAGKAIEAALASHTAAAAADLRLHAGLHAGDVIDEGDNVYGGAVNLAARVCGMSEPGEVLVSETVRALARTSAGVRFEDRGIHELKGIEEPQRLYAVLPNA
jgi:class 3 adenylate cyclase